MPIRNPVVRHGALLRKGGAHTSNVSGQRHQSKRQLDEGIDEYFNQSKDPDLNTSDSKGLSAEGKTTQGITNKGITNKGKANKGRSDSAPSSLCYLSSNLRRYQACA